jgi:hypothetical protein
MIPYHIPAESARPVRYYTPRTRHINLGFVDDLCNSFHLGTNTILFGSIASLSFVALSVLVEKACSGDEMRTC